jgi:GT2 family glycosyltransferase
VTAMWCTEVELAGSLPGELRPPSASYTSVRVLVRLHGVPLGVVERPVHGALDVTELLAGVDRELFAAVNSHLAADGLPRVASVRALGPGAGLPEPTQACPSRILPDQAVTVVVCTRDRTEALRASLARLRRLRFPRLEILIVDNAPSDDATRDAFSDCVGDDERFSYVREPRPGASCARNRGLREATGEIVAYTDDDVSVDPDWVRALAAGFRHDGVACVTGLVCTASINGPAERYFDARVSWGASCRPAIHRLGRPGNDGLFPYAPGIFGTGASFAVRADTMRALGGFDEALGPGTKSGGGEDMDAFVRIVLAGHALAYEPAAVAWHHHRADLDGLRRQMFTYGIGLSAFISKHLADRSTRHEVLRRIPRGVTQLARIGANTHASLNGTRAEVPATALLLHELGGFVVGPVRYALARYAVPPQAT